MATCTRTEPLGQRHWATTHRFVDPTTLMVYKIIVRNGQCLTAIDQVGKVKTFNYTDEIIPLDEPSLKKS